MEYLIIYWYGTTACFRKESTFVFSKYSIRFASIQKVIYYKTELNVLFIYLCTVKCCFVHHIQNKRQSSLELRDDLICIKINIFKNSKLHFQQYFRINIFKAEIGKFMESVNLYCEIKCTIINSPPLCTW